VVGKIIGLMILIILFMIRGLLFLSQIFQKSMTLLVKHKVDIPENKKKSLENAFVILRYVILGIFFVLSPTIIGKFTLPLAFLSGSSLGKTILYRRWSLLSKK